ncbi:MAG: glycosyltransferase [Planctomycetes bacterium]|nr:glycosyltransferase [Planctomycetota bacterium]
MAAPCLSVIIPVYNAAPWLRQCLDSVVGQEGPTAEILLVDDGSTDGSGDICDEYRSRDNRVIVLHGATAGAGPARNRGLERARGEFLVFVDADDLVEPGAFAALVAAQRESGADVVRGAWRVITADGQPGTMRQTYYPARRGMAYIQEEGDRHRVCFNPTVWAALFRRTFLTDHGVRFEHRLSGQDALLVLALTRLNPRYRYLDRIVYAYRRQAFNSITLTFSPSKRQRIRDQRVFLDALYQYFLAENDPGTVDAAMGEIYVDLMFRYLVVCAASSLLSGGTEAAAEFSRVFDDSSWSRFLPGYFRERTAGRSWLLPWLYRLGWRRLAFALCRHKARRRYGPEIAALSASTSDGE